MKRHFFRFLSLLLFAVATNIAWGQDKVLQGEYHVDGEATMRTLLGRLAKVVSKANVDSIVITGGVFNTADLNTLASGFTKLRHFEITNGIDSVVSFGINNRRSNSTSGSNSYAGCYDWDNMGRKKLTLPAIKTFIAHKLEGIGDQTFHQCYTLEKCVLPQLKYLGGEYTKKGDVYDRRYNFSDNGGMVKFFLDVHR